MYPGNFYTELYKPEVLCSVQRCSWEESRSSRVRRKKKVGVKHRQWQDKLSSKHDIDICNQSAVITDSKYTTFFNLTFIAGCEYVPEMFSGLYEDPIDAKGVPTSECGFSNNQDRMAISKSAARVTSRWLRRSGKETPSSTGHFHVGWWKLSRMSRKRCLGSRGRLSIFLISVLGWIIS